MFGKKKPLSCERGFEFRNLKELKLAISIETEFGYLRIPNLIQDVEFRSY